MQVMLLATATATTKVSGKASGLQTTTGSCRLARLLKTAAVALHAATAADAPLHATTAADAPLHATTAVDVDATKLHMSLR